MYIYIPDITRNDVPDISFQFYLGIWAQHRVTYGGIIKQNIFMLWDTLYYWYLFFKIELYIFKTTVMGCVQTACMYMCWGASTVSWQLICLKVILLPLSGAFTKDCFYWYSGDYDLVVNRHVSIHLSLVDSIQVRWFNVIGFKDSQLLSKLSSFLNSV